MIHSSQLLVIRRLALVGSASGVLVLAGSVTGVLPAIGRETAQVVSSIITCHSSGPCAGWTNSGTGSGVEGQTTFRSSSVSNGTAGVAGIDASSSGSFNSGVLGTSKKGVGVTGSSARYNGVVGVTANPSNTTGYVAAAVIGNDASTDGGSGNIGVWGYSPNGTGVLAQSATFIALDVISGSGVGISTSSFSGYPFVSGTGSATPAIFAESNLSSGGELIRATNGASTKVLDLDNAGNLTITGKIFTAGSCHVGCAMTEKSSRKVASFASQSAYPTIEDYGQAQLRSGHAVVALDPSFANVIDEQADYLVFVTPRGDTRGLYVTNASHRGFEVWESQGGRNSVAFDYRIVAKPYGTPSMRLPMLDVRNLAQPPRSKTFSSN